VYDENKAGIYKHSFLTNAKLEASQAVYPRASWVFLNPPLGKEEPSVSPLIKSLPVKFRITFPSKVVVIKLSCFSALVPLSG
jgi:hypothetical protein